MVHPPADPAKGDAPPGAEDAAGAADVGPASSPPAPLAAHGARVHSIGIVLARGMIYAFRDPFMRLVLAGIADECDPRGVSLSFASAERLHEARWGAQTAGVDALIAISLHVGEDLVSFARRACLPFVSVDLDAGPGTSSILIEDRRGGYAVARHLLELGHRRIGLLTFETGPAPRYGWADAQRLRETEHRFEHDRIVGYAEALAEYGIALEQLPIMEAPNERPRAVPYARDLLDSHPELTAVVAMSDVLALAAMDAARALGLRIPRDLSIIGFDDIPEAAETQPPLSTVAQPIVEKGRLAARIVLDALPPRSEVLGVKLVIRGSTGPPRDGPAPAGKRAGRRPRPVASGRRGRPAAKRAKRRA